MPTKAYILIETTLGTSNAVADTLSSLPGVEMVDTVTGPYDIIAAVEGSDLVAVGQLISSRIHRINGVVRTMTCFVINLNRE